MTSSAVSTQGSVCAICDAGSSMEENAIFTARRFVEGAALFALSVSHVLGRVTDWTPRNEEDKEALTKAISTVVMLTTRKKELGLFAGARVSEARLETD